MNIITDTLTEIKNMKLRKVTYTIQRSSISINAVHSIVYALRIWVWHDSMFSINDMEDYDAHY